MFSAIHDSLLVAYGVDASRKNVTFTCEAHHGSASGPFSILFHGAVAHCFPAPQLPAILSNIEQVSAETLLQEQWPHISRGFRGCGWPGSWAESLETATGFVHANNLFGFSVSSSYGLEGWVIAVSMDCVPLGVI
jgi:hypothetical protein